MTFSDQADVPVLGTIQFYRKQFLAEPYLEGLQQPPQQIETHNVHFSSETTTVWSTH
jgi:hypothetical protein